jgi:hypothetical protein
MNWTYAGISLVGSFEGSRELIKQKIEEAMNIACTYLENELKHDSISYSFIQFKTDTD